jgi:hypothetical protein
VISISTGTLPSLLLIALAGLFFYGGLFYPPLALAVGLANAAFLVALAIAAACR